MALVHMQHSKSGDELKVPARKVRAYEGAGWRRKAVKPAKAAPVADKSSRNDEKVSD